MFVSWFKYKKLLDQRDELICTVQALKRYQREREGLIPESVSLREEIRQLEEDVQKYKQLYADELQKRLGLAEKIREMEE